MRLYSQPNFPAPFEDESGCFVNAAILVPHNASFVRPTEHGQILKHVLCRRLPKRQFVGNPAMLQMLECPPFLFFLWRENLIRHLPSLQCLKTSFDAPLVFFLPSL